MPIYYVQPKEMQNAGVSVQQYMNNWLYQINYPHVEIKLINDGTKSVVEFFQERFSLFDYDIFVFEDDIFPPIVSPYGYK
jgi:hypothetical protein